MKALLQDLFKGKRLSFKEAKQALLDIGKGNSNNSIISSFLTVFMMRNISLQELEGFKEALLELCIKIDLSEYNAIDLCGTGGDGLKTLNISTTVAILLSSVGIPIAKHGNRAASSLSGSSDIISELKIPNEKNSKKIIKRISNDKFVYLNAPFFYPNLSRVGEVRKKIGIKTIFNYMGPTLNPLGAKFQILGTIDKGSAEIMSKILSKIKNKKFTIFFSEDGLDEISIFAPTNFYFKKEKSITKRKISHMVYKKYLTSKLNFKDIKGGLPSYNANRLNELKKMLQNAGLKFVASYSGGNLIFKEILDDELDKIKKSILIAKELGAEHFVIGGGAKRFNGTNEDDYNRLGESLNKIDSLCKKNELQGHYHPHLSTIVEGADEVKKIFELTSINFCPDTAHLFAAGADPNKLILELKDKISYIHLKGFQKNPFKFTPLDEGDLDNGKIIETLKKINFNGWITNELDSWADPFEGALRNYKFVEKYYKKN